MCVCEPNARFMHSVNIQYRKNHTITHGRKESNAPNQAKKKQYYEIKHNCYLLINMELLIDTIFHCYDIVVLIPINQPIPIMHVYIHNVYTNGIVIRSAVAVVLYLNVCVWMTKTVFLLLNFCISYAYVRLYLVHKYEIVRIFFISKSHTNIAEFFALFWATNSSIISYDHEIFIKHSLLCDVLWKISILYGKMITIK